MAESHKPTTDVIEVWKMKNLPETKRKRNPKTQLSSSTSSPLAFFFFFFLLSVELFDNLSSFNNYLVYIYIEREREKESQETKIDPW